MKQSRAHAYSRQPHRLHNPLILRPPHLLSLSYTSVHSTLFYSSRSVAAGFRAVPPCKHRIQRSCWFRHVIVHAALSCLSVWFACVAAGSSPPPPPPDAARQYLPLMTYCSLHTNLFLQPHYSCWDGVSRMCVCIRDCDALSLICVQRFWRINLLPLSMLPLVSWSQCWRL